MTLVKRSYKHPEPRFYRGAGLQLPMTRHIGDLPDSYWLLAICMNSASFTMRIPSSCALASLEPASSPATT